MTHDYADTCPATPPLTRREWFALHLYTTARGKYQLSMADSIHMAEEFLGLLDDKKEATPEGGHSTRDQ